MMHTYTHTHSHTHETKTDSHSSPNTNQHTNIMEKVYSELNRLYTDPSFPGSHSGLANFWKHLRNSTNKTVNKLTFKQIKEWSTQQSRYTHYKPARKKFMRKSYKLYSPNNIWEGDLLDMSALSKWNKGVNFILFLIDQFTKKLYVYPCKSKDKVHVLEGIRHIFEKQTLSRPRILYTDNGGEFSNHLVDAYLNSINIKHVTTKDKSIKCAIVERANRTIKKKLIIIADDNWKKWLPWLEDVTKAFNNTPNKTTKFSPSKIDPSNVNQARINIERTTSRVENKALQTRGKVWDKNLRKPLLKIGDYVHIQKQTSTFQRGFQRQYTDEIFQITDVNSDSHPITYKLSDLEREPVSSYFVYPELNKIALPSHFRINNPKEAQFTDPASHIKYVLVKVAEFWKPIWIPQSELDKRNAADKKRKEITSSKFLYYLNH